MRIQIWLAIAIALVLIGLIIFAAVMAAYGWDFTKLSTLKYETNTYPINDAFSSISINTDTADILFTPANDEKCSVVCYETEKVKHTVTVQGDILTIHLVDNRQWHEYIGINFNSPKITVYLPQREYNMLSIKGSTGDVEIPQNFQCRTMEILMSTGDVLSSASASENVKIKTTTGSIHIQNISAAALDLTVSTGKVQVTNAICKGDLTVHVSTGKTNLTNIQCLNLISKGNTGDISLKNVIATGNFSIERTTGDIQLNGSDAAAICMNTDTGDIIGTLLSSKIFLASTDTGHVDVPQTATGGTCQIETSTGNIKIDIVS